MTVRDEDKAFIAQVYSYIFIGHDARLDPATICARSPEQIVDRLALLIKGSMPRGARALQV